MKKAIILRGIPGAGKSHRVRQFLGDKQYQQMTTVSADHYFESRGDGEYDFDPRLLPMAHNECMRNFLQALFLKHEVVVVDNTNIHRWEYNNYELAARLAGYEVEIVEVMPTTIEELRVCARRNTHGVPAEIVAKMAIEFDHDTRATVYNIGGIE